MKKLSNIAAPPTEQSKSSLCINLRDLCSINRLAIVTEKFNLQKIREIRDSIKIKMLRDFFDKIIQYARTIYLYEQKDSVEYVSDTDFKNYLCTIDMYHESVSEFQSYCSSNPNLEYDTTSTENVIEEICDIESIDEVDTNGYPDKLRMEMGFILLEKVGCDTEKRGNKTNMSELVSIMTGLDKRRCKNYCSQRDLNKSYHYESIKAVNRLLNILGIDISI